MKNIARRAFLCYFLAGVLLLGTLIFAFRWFADGGSWASSAFNRHLYDNSGQLASGTVLDRDGDVLTTVENGKRTYYPNETVRKATLHLVGDTRGSIGTGALNAYADKLTGYNFINGAYDGKNGGALYLTIDARYNYEAYRALNGHKGTVAVYNYKTGEVLCLVSAPTYDPLNIPADLETSERYKGVYLNRFLSSTFTPGSVFKTVTLSAALEKLPDLAQRRWTCEGSVRIGEDVVVCSGCHGEQDISAAMANSCNVVFAQLAAELGADTMEKYTRKAGLMDSYSVSGIPTAKGTFVFDDQSMAQLGWAGVGQYEDHVNPCALMVYMGAIAGGGRAAVPYLVEKTVDAMGISSLPHFTQKTPALIHRSTAEKVAQIMANNVEASYGSSRFSGMDICAKSGTAEVGGDQTAHAWFAGFLRGKDTPYAFVVLVENGGSGSAVAGTVAAKVLDLVVNGY